MKKKKKPQRMWIYSPKQEKINPSEEVKKDLTDFFTPLIEKFKEVFVLSNPDKSYNYCVDIYTKWHRNAFYFCQKFASESPHAIRSSFDSSFVKLEYKGEDTFHFSYFRHTGKWHLVSEFVTKEKALEMILENQVFYPL
jgi:hypothetical protein